MPTRLRNPRAHEGSLVDDPANPKARVMLFKRGGDNGVNKAMKTEDGVKKTSRLRKLAESFIPEPIRKIWYAGEGWSPDGDDDKSMQTLIQTLQQDGYSDQVLAVLSAALADTVDSILDDESVADKQAQIDAALKEFSDRIQAVGIVKSKDSSMNREELLQKVRAGLDDMFGTTQTTVSKEGDRVTIDKSNLPEDVRKYIDGLEQQVSKSAGGQQTEEEIMKAALPEPLRKRFEEMEKKAQEAESIAKREREERLEREFVAKAESFKGLSVKADEFGKVMKSLAEKAPEEFAKVEELLKSADEAIAKGNLFTEVGKTGAGKTGGAYEQLESIAKGKVETNKSLSFNQAFDQAVSENPQLYSQYREEVSR